MKRFLFLLLPFSLYAMEEHKLIRTYSINILVDSLKEDLIEGDLEVLEDSLCDYLPQSLDRQYALLGLPLSQEVHTLLLKKIQDYWYEEIGSHPGRGISLLLFCLKTMSSSYDLSELDPSFLTMLTNLKRALLKTELVSNNKELRDQVNCIPAQSSLLRLTVILGHFIGHDEDMYEELHGDYQAVIDEANPTIYVDLPSKYW